MSQLPNNIDNFFTIPQITPTHCNFNPSPYPYRSSGSVSKNSRGNLFEFRRLKPYTRYRLLIALNHDFLPNNIGVTPKYFDVTPFVDHVDGEQVSNNPGFPVCYRSYFYGVNSPSGLWYYNLRRNKTTAHSSAKYGHYHPYEFLLSDRFGKIKIRRIFDFDRLDTMYGLLRQHYLTPTLPKYSWRDLDNIMRRQYFVNNARKLRAGFDSIFGRSEYFLVEESNIQSTTGHIVELKSPVRSDNGSINPNIVTCKPPKPPEVCQPPASSESKSIVSPAFDFIQTFYVNKDRVEGSETIDLSRITLYLKEKPVSDGKKNNSGINLPGFTVAICECDGSLPVPSKKIPVSEKYVEWTSCLESTDATSKTLIEFDTPVRLNTGKHYGIMIDVDDEGYVFWISKKGWLMLGTSNPSPGSSKDHSGELFTRANFDQFNTSAENKSVLSGTSSNLVSSDELDLKFDVEVAEYTVNDVNVVFVNTDIEYFTVPDTTDIFFSGEMLFKDVGAVSAQTVSISEGSTTLTGTSTVFTNYNEGDTIVLMANNYTDQISHVGIIESIQSDTELTLDRGPTQDYTDQEFQITIAAQTVSHNPDTNNLVVDNSTANSSVRFTANDTITGAFSGLSTTITSVDAVDISSFRTSFDVNIPSSFKTTASYNFAYDNSGAYTISSASKPVNFVDANYVTTYDAKLLSKSIELDSAHNSTLYQQDADANTNSGTEKSTELNILFDYLGLDNTVFKCPVLNVETPHIVTNRWIINNDATNEHTNKGNALSKHISTRMTFGNSDKVAEDIKIISTAFRPIGTNVKVYAKIMKDSDSDAFEDKNWTLLDYTRNGDLYSDVRRSEDFREYEYGFPIHPPVESTLDGSVDTSGHSTPTTVDITGSGTTFTSDLQIGDLIKIYDPLAPDDDYVIRMVTNVSTDTTIAVNENIAVAAVQASSLKIQKLSTPYTAFRCEENNNVVRYFSENGGYYDGYNTLTVKTVLLASNTQVVPSVDDYSVIALSS